MKLRRHEDLTELADLLDSELPERRFDDASYLEWLYDQNPHGPSFHLAAFEEGQPKAHYALVAQDYRDRAGRERMVFSLNAVTSRTTQRRGWFTTIAPELYEQAREWGAVGIVAVANDKSTPAATDHLGYRLLGPMPVRLAPRTGRVGSAWTTHGADEAFLASSAFEEIFAGLDDAPVTGWVNRWTTEHARWRLAAPNCGPYAIHVGPDLVAVSSSTTFGPVPVAALLKLLPRKGWTDGGSARHAINAACGHHGAPLAVWAGHNRRVRVRGIQPPRRFQPAPLNLLFHSLSSRAPLDRFTVDTFELGDCDAY